MQPAKPILARDPGLGTVVCEWRAGWWYRIQLSVLILFLLGMFGIIGAAMEDLVVLGAAGVATALLLGFVQYQQSGVRVVVYDHGIERTGRFGTRRLAWAELRDYRLDIIDTTTMGLYGGVGGLLMLAIMRRFWGERLTRAVILSAVSGTKLKLGNNLARYGQLLDWLVPQLTERLFGPAKQAFDQGQLVTFGPHLALQRGVGITATGLFGKKHLLGFAELESVGIEGGLLLIRKVKNRRPWKRLLVSQVLNVRVFEKLAAHETQAPASEDLPLAWTV
jgi:hypothetical protein